MSGFVEQRPARVVVAVACVCASLRQSQQLSALVTPPLLIALETMPALVLAMLPDDSVSLRLADVSVTLHACGTSRQVYDSVPICYTHLQLYLDGFLHVRVT